MEARRAPRVAAEDAFLDAAERLLVEVGYAGITTRRLAEEAGANHGLVHYYFGSMENLLVRVLERFTDRLIERQRAMYAQALPFAEKWRQAMRYLEQDRPYQKVWLELTALSWNRPDVRDRIALVDERWRAVLLDAFEEAKREHEIEMPVDALVSLVMTFNIGLIVEELTGISTGHRELLDWIERWLDDRSR